MSREVHQYLMVPGNLEAAIQLETILPGVKLSIYDEFWGRVRDLLDQRLQQENLTVLWCPGLSEVDGGNRSWVGISFRGKGGGFCVGAANLTGGPGGSCYGINRGMLVNKDEWVPRDQELASTLGKDGYKSEPWWVGAKYFSYAGGPSLDLLSINQDNREGGEVARQVAGLIWDLFIRHRLTLENLNQSYPYS